LKIEGVDKKSYQQAGIFDLNSGLIEKSMGTRSDEISNQLKNNAVGIIKSCKVIYQDPAYRFLVSQIYRSATSAGANYEEACGAESRADFIHKLHIAYKELRETAYWLSIIQMANLGSKEDIEVCKESTEKLLRIIGKSLITSKKNMNKPKDR
jgi:four helix bundle protein